MHKKKNMNDYKWNEMNEIRGFLHCNLNKKWYLQTASYIEAVLQTVGTTITNLQAETNNN